MMEPEHVREWRRWAASEQASLEDEADAAFAALFAAVPARIPASGLGERIAGAVARAAARQARLAKAAFVAAALVGVTLTVALLLQLPRLITAALDLVIAAAVSASLALGRGLDVWAVLAQLARAAGAVVVTPQGTYMSIGLAALAIGALYVLQRMLEIEERSSS